MNLEDVKTVLASLEREGVEYVVFGAVALNLHGIVWATEDLDLFVRPTAENIERLKKALKAVYHDPLVDEIDTAELIDDYPAVRYFPPDSGEGGFFLDILTRLGEFASFDALESQVVEIEDVRVRVVTPRTLYWLKKGTVRPQDHFDAENLREKFDLAENPDEDEEP